MTAAPIAGYPLRWEADVLLADGGVAHLRPSGVLVWPARVPVEHRASASTGTGR